tara:strand:- start:3386 stop:3493 length:108 start_codon:yes stop_codon:yes gene_type:complete
MNGNDDQYSASGDDLDKSQRHDDSLKAARAGTVII